MCQFTIVVEAQGLDPAIVIFIKLNLVLDHFYTSLEDAFIFDSLAHYDFAGACPRAFRWMST